MDDCLFCKIVSKEIPAEIVYEDDQVLAFKDINPAAPVHVLLVTKEHIASLNDISAYQKELMGHLQFVASKVAQDMGIAQEGYRMVLNCGKWGGQEIMHIHFHLLGGKELGWPPE